jgi:integrase
LGRIQSFLSHYETEKTKRGYLGHLDKFLRFVYSDSRDTETKADSYFTEGRNYLKDVEGFLVSTSKEAPMTRRMRLSTVKLFLIDNDVELGERNWKALSRRIKGKRAITLDKVPTTDELRRIVHHLQVNGKALVLTLASSGMRVGETLQLKLSDIDLTSDPPVISIRGDYTKTGESRWAFISSEAKEALEAWLRVRGPYIKSATGKSHIYRKEVEGEERISPFAVTTAERLWRSAIRKAGLDIRDSRTLRYQIHLHVLSDNGGDGGWSGHTAGNIQRGPEQSG